MTKSELRSTYLQKRKEISEAEYHQFNHQVCEQFFFFMDLSLIKVIHTYLPLINNQEPDTWPIINRIRSEFPHVRFSIPRVNNDKDILENYFFEGLHQLEDGNWGIKQPKQGVPTESEKIDLALVPLLAFDLSGHRIGYGKGYYDRFLSSCRADCKKVGLSFFPPVENIPVEPQDIGLDHCVTPKKVFSFSSTP